MPPTSFNMDFDVIDDPKIVRLVASLGDAAFMAWVALVAHAGKHHWKEDGRLDEYTEAEIEAFARWRGERGKFFGALKRLGLIEQTENGFAIPHMGERNPHFAAAHEASEKARLAALARWEKDRRNTSSNAPSNAQLPIEHMPDESPSICPNDAQAMPKKRREEKRRELQEEEEGPPQPRGRNDTALVLAEEFRNLQVGQQPIDLIASQFDEPLRSDILQEDEIRTEIHRAKRYRKEACWDLVNRLVETKREQGKQAGRSVGTNRPGLNQAQLDEIARRESETNAPAEAGSSP